MAEPLRQVSHTIAVSGASGWTEIGGRTSAVAAALVLRSNFRGSDYVLRNSANHFLVLLPNTTEVQAQYALDRLTDKVDNWNLENDSEMATRHELSTCPPGGNLWETLREI